LASLAVAGGACGSAARAAGAGSPPKTAPAATPAPAPRANDPYFDCQAGSLPRVDDKSIGQDGTRTLLEMSQHGTVAVVWDGRQATIVGDCKLGQPYLDIPGKTPAIHFRPTNQALFRTDEISPECRRATHVVAAFLSEQVPASGTPRATHVAGVLVPLPCPPVADKAPAPGCIGKGLTGRQRQARAEARREELRLVPVQSVDVARPLEIYALTPDDYWALQNVASLRDPGLADQGRWLLSQYDLKESYDSPAVSAALKPPQRRRPPPDVHWDESDRELMRNPAFFSCFSDRIHPDVHFNVIP
jgi:hypothetical protein